MSYSDTLNGAYRQLLYTLVFVIIVLTPIAIHKYRENPRVLESDLVEECMDSGQYITAKDLIIKCQVH
jgi:hypothetical protein